LPTNAAASIITAFKYNTTLQPNLLIAFAGDLQGTQPLFEDF
jgi:hypothetical protein